ncbi:MAG: hypothetical protein V2A79_00400 [Planctomycetota bacterium]
MRKRGELVERTFAHGYDTGGMRRTHLKKHENILKRLLIHTAGFNLSLILRGRLGIGTARGLQDLARAGAVRFCAGISRLWEWIGSIRVSDALDVVQGSNSRCQTRYAA